MIQLCPLCGGQGFISKPSYIAGDVHNWCDNMSGGYTCMICGGHGYVEH